MSFCHHTARLREPWPHVGQSARGRTGKPFLPSMSKSLALTQKRGQHRRYFSATPRGSSALCCGRAAGTWTRETLLLHTLFCVLRGGNIGVWDWSFQSFARTQPLKCESQGMGWAPGIWAHPRNLSGISGSHSSRHGHTTLLEGRGAREADVLTGFVLCASGPKGLEEPSVNQKLHLVPMAYTQQQAPHLSG